ncbi:MAG: hypothetical protein QOF74_4405 [Caballeronia mineralivorans]|nr:hypothetical protein [Caballeronia mineralivorans]
MADVVSFAAHSRRVGLRLKRLSKMHGGKKWKDELSKSRGLQH